ncbi:DUF2057 domain-containing protein [Shewanella sp. Scap07]|uniref:DUF2057 domain-containing protein n=1 Tax=Shewanella sp. Scap07 TaxID=2589987 RepID=UPI0015BB44FD|nr:DUF2057 domain-containing protein [Shewanella sp. Scap07]QLE84998.1 DUF2057 domain-containing protein [Shewanella sp. Scap07]
MKSLLPITAILALLGASSAMAANLSIPMSFEYLAVDGKKIDTSLFSHQSDLDLSEGSHKIAIRYHDMVQDDFSDSESFIKSSPFIVTIDVDGDYNYTLSPAEGVVKRPKSFAKAPQVVITREDKGNVNYKITQTDYTEESFFDSLFSSSNNNQDIDTVAAAATGAAVAGQPTAPVSKPKPQSATVAATATTAAVATTPAANSPKASGDATHAEQMLQYWWLQADEATRKEFMSWAIKQL